MESHWVIDATVLHGIHQQGSSDRMGLLPAAVQIPGLSWAPSE